MPTQTLPFPAVVTAPDGRHFGMVKLRAVGETVQVFAYERGATRYVADLPASDLGAADGWLVSKGAGCGCGHPIKRANLDQIAAKGLDPTS